MGKRIWMISLLLFPAALGQDRSKFPVNDHHIVYHDVRVDASGGAGPRDRII